MRALALFTAFAAAALAVFAYRSDLLGQATTSAHADASRQAVGWTAFCVAALRAAEAERPDALARDEVARALFSPRGPAPLAWRAALLLWRCYLAAWPKFLPHPPEGMVQLMAVRTRFLDDHIAAAASPQRVTIGSGLDARSVRLPDPDASIYEIDFDDMLGAKRNLFAAAGYELQNTSLVGTDLSQSPDRWRRDLKAAGFDQDVETTWLIEGVTGYLQPAELDALLKEISGLSAAGSVLLATWRATCAGLNIPFVAAASKRSVTRRLRPSEAGDIRTNMHRATVDDPSALLKPLGWDAAVDQVSLEAAAAHYGVDMKKSPVGGYWLTAHVKTSDA